LDTHVHLILGKDIHVDYEGLSADLTGALELKDTSERVMTATGRIHILNGKYSVRGQKLAIKSGSLQFRNSPIDNPDINIRAIRHLKPAETFLDTAFGGTFALQPDIQAVGVYATGPLQNPKLKLFSTPAGLSQADMLSYLLTGQAINSTKMGSPQLLIQSANALNIVTDRGTGGVTDNLKHSLGLSEFGLISEEGSEGKEKAGDHLFEHTALMLGKRLSPRLYLNYSIGLVDGASHIRIRYKLNDMWSIQSHFSSEGTTGATLLYHIERD